MKKKILAIMLSAMMLALTACGSTSTNETSKDAEVIETIESTEVVVESTEPESTDVQESETVEATEMTEDIEESVESTEIETTEVPETETVEPESTEVVEAPVATEKEVPVAPAYTYTDLAKVMYAQQTVNVRDLPDTSGNKLGSLSTNDEVNVTGQCNETSWYRIDYNGSTAYVSNKYLKDTKIEVQQAPAETPAQTTQTSSSSNANGSFPYALYEISDVHSGIGPSGGLYYDYIVTYYCVADPSIKRLDYTWLSEKEGPIKNTYAQARTKLDSYVKTLSPNYEIGMVNPMSVYIGTYAEGSVFQEWVCLDMICDYSHVSDTSIPTEKYNAHFGGWNPTDNPEHPMYSYFHQQQ